MIDPKSFTKLYRAKQRAYVAVEMLREAQVDLLEAEEDLLRLEVGNVIPRVEELVRMLDEAVQESQ